MRLFGLFKKKNKENIAVVPDDLSPDEKRLLDHISKINASGGNLTPELHQQLRDFQTAWLERHYDFNTIEGVNSIPERKDIPGAPAPRSPVSSPTGKVYYYLRHKAYMHEADGKMELAIACLRKSVAILKKSDYFSADEAYPLVKILARAGRIDEAYQEKRNIDAHAAAFWNALDKARCKQIANDAAYFKTDLVIMNAHGSTCPECAKYQGRVYSISGKSRKFPKVPDFFFTLGAVHDGCGHGFSPYIDGVSDPDLSYTLSVHPLQNKVYGKDIVTFSNRPFVDDRTNEAKEQAAKAQEKYALECAQKRRYEDSMIETEARRGQEARDYAWLQANLPDKCPKSISGFRRMKTQNTKNYQALKQAAAELGREI